MTYTPYGCMWYEAEDVYIHNTLEHLVAACGMLVQYIKVMFVDPSG